MLYPAELRGLSQPFNTIRAAEAPPKPERGGYSKDVVPALAEVWGCSFEPSTIIPALLTPLKITVSVASSNEHRRLMGPPHGVGASVDNSSDITGVRQDRGVMDDTDRTKLNHLDLSQDATVVWDGPDRSFSKLSSAIRCVVEEVVNESKIPPAITIFESPYLLEIEQIEYIYKSRLPMEKGYG